MSVICFLFQILIEVVIPVFCRQNIKMNSCQVVEVIPRIRNSISIKARTDGSSNSLRCCWTSTQLRPGSTYLSIKQALLSIATKSLRLTHHEARRSAYSIKTQFVQPDMQQGAVRVSGGVREWVFTFECPNDSLRHNKLDKLRSVVERTKRQKIRRISTHMINQN